MSRKWTEVDDTQFKAMCDAQLTIKQIAAVTGRTENSITSRRFYLALPSFDKRAPWRGEDPLPRALPTPPAPTTPPRAPRIRARPKPPGSPKPLNEMTLYDRMIANAYHLVDLKRAGHSPKDTEFSISPDAICPMKMVIVGQDRSLMGSQGAMCAERIGGR